MKAVFGIVSLLVALAGVGVLASRQTKTVAGTPFGASAAAAAPADTDAKRQVRQLPEQVRQDVDKALDQAARRADATP